MFQLLLDEGRFINTVLGSATNKIHGVIKKESKGLKLSAL